MAALAYLLLPVSGTAAFFLGRASRTRFHGAQAIALALVWAALLFGCSAISPTATQIAFVLGGVLWLTLFVSAAIGRDITLPLLGPACARVAGHGANGN
jgi:uncharacterized membrane protein